MWRESDVEKRELVRRRSNNNPPILTVLCELGWWPKAGGRLLSTESGWFSLTVTLRSCCLLTLTLPQCASARIPQTYSHKIKRTPTNVECFGKCFWLLIYISPIDPAVCWVTLTLPQCAPYSTLSCDMKAMQRRLKNGGINNAKEILFCAGPDKTN